MAEAERSEYQRKKDNEEAAATLILDCVADFFRGHSRLIVEPLGDGTMRIGFQR